MALTTDLVAYYPLSETTGNRNTVVGSRNLTQSGGVTYETGIVGTAAKFTFASSQYLNHADHNDLDLSTTSSASEWTICGWAYCESFPNLQQIIAKGDSSMPDGIQMEYGLQIGIFGDVLAQVDYGNDYREAKWDAQIAPEEWFFVAAVLRKTGEDSGLTIYGGKTTDSELTKNTTRFTPSAAANNQGVLTIGSLYGNQNFMNGRIDEVGLWKRALTDDEVAQLFSGGSGTTYPFGKTAGQDMDWVSPPAIVTRPSIRTVPAEYPLPPLGDLLTGAGVGGTPTVDSWRSETEVPVLPRPLYHNVYAEPIINNREIVIPPVDAWWSNAEIPTPSRPGHLEAMAVPAVGTTAISEVNVPEAVAPPEEYTPARTEDVDEYRSRNA
ncbi:MAG: putative concanavalin A-like lectin/glucanases superfamily protein [Prokaryotic dsDNA virus sp.]|nr:MAG: putative concanavalin A-like lectin/glucanases superfamily protein [Prokaryotic dsDNA virus sp.]|tara:strand:+ start:24773 stop:25918 length:1146 start_codon:yes stop_codon:yes gene_type:complete